VIYGGRRQGLVEWEGQNQPEIDARNDMQPDRQAQRDQS
jgi:hypothetical protein